MKSSNHARGFDAKRSFDKNVRMGIMIDCRKTGRHLTSKTLFLSTNE